MRLSSYSVLSDPLPGGGYALMNGCSGAIDLISNRVADILMKHATFRSAQGKAWTPRDKPSLKETNGEKFLSVEILEDHEVGPPLSSETVEFLLERGHLTRVSHEDERSHVARLANLLHEDQKARPVFMIVPTFDCNYRCTYCFERPLQNGLVKINSKVNYGSQNVLMTSRHVEAIYESIQQIQSGRPITNNQIVLYGGEPLDADNKELVFEIVTLGVAKGFEFAAISNGHDWQHFMPLMGAGGIKQIQVSIDGPKQIHDKRRIYRKGGSSFDRILTNVNLVLEQSDTLIEIRVHVDPSNIHLFDEVLEVCRKEGWADNRSIVIYANTVYAKDPKSGKVGARIDNGEIMQRLHDSGSRYKNVFIGAPALNARMQLLPSMTEGAAYRLKSTYCAANTGNYIFAPDGHVYACWESVGKDCSRVGSYLTEEGLVFNQEMTEKWFNRSTARIPECLECPFALVCGGGCAQYSEYNTGTLYKPFCDDFERIFRTALTDTVEEFVRAQELGINGEIERLPTFDLLG